MLNVCRLLATFQGIEEVGVAGAFLVVVDLVDLMEGVMAMAMGMATTTVVGAVGVPCLIGHHRLCLVF